MLWTDGTAASVGPRLRKFGSTTSSHALVQSPELWKMASDLEKQWGGLDSNQRPADYEPATDEAGHLRKFMNILVRAFTWLL